MWQLLLQLTSELKDDVKKFGIGCVLAVDWLLLF
jgi:hypothetical protein